MNKKVAAFSLAVVVLAAAGVYFGKIDLTFLGLKSDVLSVENCSGTLLASKLAEYNKSVSDKTILDSYITINKCIDGPIGKTNFQVAACQRNVNLRNNKVAFITGYEACKASAEKGPQILSGSVGNDVGVNYRTMTEQEDGEDTHLNESVYNLSIRSQSESYLRELVYEMTLPLVNGVPDINITKAELASPKSGSYACRQDLAPTQPAAAENKQVVLITCNAVDGAYVSGIGSDTGSFQVGLNLSVSTILGDGEGKIRFVGGKFSITPTGTQTTNLTVSESITSTPGTIKYTMAAIDERDLTVELVALANTSSTTIPVKAVFNKLINKSTVTKDDFVVSNNANTSGLKCDEVADPESGIRTICSIKVQPKNAQLDTNITIDFAAGSAQDRTRPTPKNNAAAAQKIIHYVFGAPQIFVGAPCDTLSASCEGLDNTPQLIVKAAIGDIPEGAQISIYDNATCAGNSPVHSLSVTRDMPQVDLYEKTALTQGQTKTYSAKIYNNCSSLGSSSNKTATYKYTGETIAQVDRLACMSTTTFQYPKFSVGPFVKNKIELCDTRDIVAPSRCNAWQGNGTLSRDCFASGDGTLNNPYRVCTAQQLQEIDNAPGSHFRLGKSIDMTLSASWFGGKGFQPIGLTRAASGGFWGSLDGNGYEIQNLNIKRSEAYVGLFGSANGASWPGFWVNNLKLNNTTIKNPGINNATLAGYAGCAIISGVESENFIISGAQKGSGGLIGVTYLETKIFHSKAQGEISTASNMPSASSGGGWVGGLIGSVPGSMLEVNRCDTDVTINAKGAGIGGMIGNLYGSPANILKVYNSVARGKITVEGGTKSVGGLLGNATNVSVRGSSTIPATSDNYIYADDEASGDVSLVGGFVGFAGDSEFIGNRSEMAVEGHLGGSIGGFGGRMDNTSASQNSSVAEVGGLNTEGPRGIYVGGFVGNINSGTYTNNYSTSDISTSSVGPARWIGGFGGLVGSAVVQKNYATGNIRLQNFNNHTVGGFIGAMGQNDNAPYTLTDNFSTGGVNDGAGLYQGYENYVGGFVGSITKKPNDVFENNHFINTYSTRCSGVASVSNVTCDNVTSDSVFSGSTHAVYTRSGNTWDFSNTWVSSASAVPTLK